MKRLLTLLALTTISMAVIPAKASAAPFEWFSIKVESRTAPVLPVPIEQPEPKPEIKEPPKPEPVVYLVVEGDNLSKIGTKYNVEWQRLWAKNTQLTNPDLIYVGDKITIPEPSEQLKRDLPAVVALPAKTPGVVAAAPVYDGSNTYDYGYCTWYVKNRRGASIPNGLGNANTWYSRAAGMGMAVGSTPRAGAVGTTTRGSLGHVVYVESVNADGSINISEMNAPTWGAVTHRTASAGEFLYIY
jgi:surface antigen